MTDPDEFDFTKSHAADRLILRREVLPTGVSDAEIRRGLRDNTIERVWWGSYVPTTGADDSIARREQLYVEKVHAAIRTGGRNRYPSHPSAAALLSIPLLQPDWSTVHFTSRTSGRKSPGLIIHQAPLPHDHLVDLHGLVTTGIGRTVCDEALNGTLRQAVCALDSGRYQARLRSIEVDLEAIASTMGGRHGITMLRNALPLSTDLSESIGESLSRCVMAEVGLPAPELQVEVIVDDGSVKRCDFGWRDEHGNVLVVGEFDGRIKYHRESAASGERLAEDVIYAEKLREDAIRDCDIIVVRWTWSELKDPQMFAAKVRRALRRAGIAAA